MENQQPNRKPEKVGDDAALFLDLKAAIAEELAGIEDANLQNAFKPMGEGLGLNSPQKGPVFPPVPPPASKQAVETAESQTELREPVLEPPPQAPKQNLTQTLGSVEKIAEAVSKEPPLPPPMPKPTVAASKGELETVFEESEVAKKEDMISSTLRQETTEQKAIPTPPPLKPPTYNKVPWIRRVLAAMMDQLFVMTLWGLACAITLKLLSGSLTAIPQSLTGLADNTRFLTFLGIEFVGLWVCYFAVCIGFLDVTFGMWVWGIRVNYPKQGRVPHYFRRVFRAFFSVLFYAPMLPLLLLSIVGKKGRDLLDVMSGSETYQAA